MMKIKAYLNACQPGASSVSKTAFTFITSTTTAKTTSTTHTTTIIILSNNDKALSVLITTTTTKDEDRIPNSFLCELSFAIRLSPTEHDGIILRSNWDNFDLDTIPQLQSLTLILEPQLRGDLLQAFRIVKGLDCSLAFEDFFEFATTTNLRGHPSKLRTQQARLDVRKFSFSVRVVKPWNELPADVVMSPSI
nr:unnamed protein product [Spirometra erinaceieuropaei]